jgi:hypothetical protein
VACSVLDHDFIFSSECPEEFPYIIAGICGVATRIRESRDEDMMADMPDGVDDFDMGRMTDRYMSSSMMGRMTDRHVDVDVPTSTAWCANVLSRINLKQFFLMPKAYFGRFDSQDVRFMVDGINEAVNRMSRPESANYSLEWVLFTPILMREGIAPHVQFPSHMQPQLTAMFNSLKENLLSEINVLCCARTVFSSLLMWIFDLLAFELAAMLLQVQSRIRIRVVHAGPILAACSDSLCAIAELSGRFVSAQRWLLDSTGPGHDHHPPRQDSGRHRFAQLVPEQPGGVSSLCRHGARLVADDAHAG